jgi:ubiquinone/menaquinone biosynthesis C-methylase UbiE
MQHNHLVKKFAKVVLNEVQRVEVGIAQKLGMIDFPVPPNSSMRKTSSRSIKHYYLSGIQTALPIATCALREKVALDQNIRVLDFGCGVGRQLLQFAHRFPAPEYHACDIDDTSVAYVQRTFPQVRALVNQFHPPLPFSDGCFDMVYSVSTFSHFCMEDQRPWLRELARVTKSGGRCFLTIEGEAALSPLAETLGVSRDSLADQLRQRGALYKEYEDLNEALQGHDTLRLASLLVGVRGSYGNTVLSAEYVVAEWNSAEFEVVDIVKGIIDYRQDLVILRRK